MSELSMALPDELIDTLAERVADILEQRQALTTANGRDEWLRGAKQIAEAMGCPPSRVYDLSGRRETTGCPIRNDGSRLTAKRGELEAWLRNGGAR
ncbi:MAG TPA: hypothetical protein VD790_10205 [Thermoleophilaceae bacterium]|nr:hypothetical protein [Thermoleophilaceae bacterium]